MNQIKIFKDYNKIYKKKMIMKIKCNKYSKYNKKILLKK